MTAPLDVQATLSPRALAALKAAYATRGKYAGRLLARCPLGTTDAAAAWTAAQLVCNPFKVGIMNMLLFTTDQKAIHREVLDLFETLPNARLFDRDRAALERLGAW